MPSNLCFKRSKKDGGGLRKSSLTLLVLFTFVSRVQSAYDTYCAAGYYLYSNAPSTGAACTPCPAGNYCQGGNKQVPAPCPSGMYSGMSASSCTVCPAGSYCNSAGKVYPCASGQYSEAGWSACAACPQGFYCTELGILTACANGYVCDWSGSSTGQNTGTGVATYQRQCRAGYFCFADKMIACPYGTYSAAGATICSVVIPGKFWTAANHPPGTCPPGTYQDQYAVQTGCIACPIGSSCSSSSIYPTECSPGYIAPALKMTSCVACPAGFYCPSPTAFPTNCAIGTYSTSGFASCAPCPAGYSCPSQATATACSTGYYSPAGTDYCTPCPAGQYCPIITQYALEAGTLAKDVGYPIVCPQGMYSGPRAAICTSCPVGTYCPYTVQGTWSQQPSICPQGMYAAAGSVSCQACPAGYSCGLNSAQNAVVAAVACSATAQITTKLHNACIACPAGYACPLLDFDSIVACGPGFYSTTSMTQCQVSNAGFYAATTQSAPVAVSTGYFAEIGFTYQTLPPPGYSMKSTDGRHTVLCKPGYLGNNGICTIAAAGTFAPLSYTLSGMRTAGIACPIGMWSVAGMLECHICMPGYECASTSIVPITLCSSKTGPTGQYNIGGDNKCSKCPAGYECNNGETISPCPPWHWSEDGTTVSGSSTSGDCYPCPDGFDCTGGIKTTCQAGFYASGQVMACVPCPPGYYCPSAGTGTPTICPGGQYSDEQATACSACPIAAPGTSTDYYATPGQAVCTPVPPGYYVTKVSGADTGVATCGQTTYSDWGDQTCSVCPNGYLCPEKTQFYFWENSCPRGSYCIAGVQTLCPVGTFGVKERAISQADGCATCPPGYYCPPGTEHFMLSPCPPGAYCPEGSQKVACPSGTTRDSLFGQSVADCTACQAGTSCGAGDTSGGTTCGMGYYCPSGVPAPGYPCPAGTFGGYKTGKIDPSQCLVCPPGNYCPSGSLNPTPAPTGYYSPLQGCDSLNMLSLCPPKYYCPNTGMTSYKGYTCTPGYYCPAGSISGTQVACPQGTYSDAPDIFDSSQCLPCPRGFMCGTATTSSSVTVCGVNQYCELGSSLSGNNNCPAGTYAPYTRSMSLFDCLPCPAGSYCLSGAVSTTCPAGSYCPVGTQKPQQYLCPQGFYSSSTGLVDATQCLHCGVGVYCPSLGMTAPTTCTNGFYNDYSTTATYCDYCPEGYYCTSASVHPVMCGYGFYSSPGQSVCTVCPLGHYCPEPVTTMSQMLSNKCPAGTFCSQACTVGGVATTCGLSTYPTFESQANGGNACEKNSFCPPGTIAEFQNITAQVTMQNLGSGYLSSAIPIPAGFIDKLLTVCPAGYYCPQGTLGANNQIGCPLGTFRATTMGMDVSDCGVCPAGYYCGVIGTSAPIICPTGYFCTEGTSLPTACPLGTYNSLTGIQDSRQCQSCSAGHYCPILGQSAVDPAMVCDSGFICYGRAFRPEPTDFTTGAICPSGGYCVQGGTTQSQCAAGYIGLFQGAYDTTACVQCQAGYYCKGAGGSSTSAVICPAGYLCPQGSSDYITAIPPQPGYYSTAGQATAIQCPFGQYQNVPGQGSCLSCPQGFFCNTIQLADPTLTSQCPVGFYCPSYQTTVTNTIGTTNLPYQIYPCPAGTYLNLVGKSSVSDCISCPAGKACETLGISVDPTSLTAYNCAAGFFCLLGAKTPYPYTADPSGNWGPCPAGSYCPAGTSVPIPCPAGTFSNQARATTVSYCMACPPGYLCPQPSSGGLTAPASPVAAGYTTSAGILSDTSCLSANLYCPLGTLDALRCPTGYYQDQPNEGNCSECSPGKYCMVGAQIACNQGYICQ